jgi:uncharacterized damage-inducible protein DinB
MSTIEVSRIALLSQQTFDGEPWYGLALCKLLAGVTAEQAAAHPIPGAHSIWQEVLHAMTWRNVAIRLLNGEKVAPVKAEENWPNPPAPPAAAAWEETLTELSRTQGQFAAALVALSDERLNDIAAQRPSPFTFYTLVHGVIQHDAYHAGQIALLKNAAGISQQS